MKFINRILDSKTGNAYGIISTPFLIDAENEATEIVTITYALCYAYKVKHEDIGMSCDEVCSYLDSPYVAIKSHIWDDDYLGLFKVYYNLLDNSVLAEDFATSYGIQGVAKGLFYAINREEIMWGETNDDIWYILVMEDATYAINHDRNIAPPQTT